MLFLTSNSLCTKTFVEKNWQLRHLACQLKQGAVIAYPTDTVYGLGCDPRQQNSLQRLIRLKHRSIDKGFILVAGNIELFTPFIHPLNDTEKNLIANTQSATTWIVPAKPQLSALLCGKHRFRKRRTLAIRVSKHPLIDILSQLLGAPLVSSSANISGKNICCNTIHIRKNFPKLDAIYATKQVLATGSSRIIDLKSKEILRKD